jgi:signal transduction histidine kinase/DNA-binding response OmpR family regulator
MTELFSSQTDLSSLPLNRLLFPDEYVAIVDDSPEIVVLLSHYFKKLDINVLTASSAAGLFALLKAEKIALTVLDIGLPDKNGNEIIQNLTHSYPDLSLIMVTGITALETALDCLRQGADDYLTKPMNIDLFHHTVHNALMKRKLVIDNRMYQEQLQKSHSRMLFLHHLNLKMNSAYLNTVELNPILQAILVGITSDDGLKFNRAFMALYNEEGTHLEGKIAVGPASREDAGKVWGSIKADGLRLDDILSAIQDKRIIGDREVNKIVKTLRISARDRNHILISSIRHKKAIQVIDGKSDTISVSQSLINTLGEDSFIVVPLYSPARSIGVIIVDNFVTRSSITPEDITDLEILAGQASLAIEHSHLYEAMVSKISELEIVTEELERNKTLLVNAERSSAISKMVGQLVHDIRNPLTSIGGTSGLLMRKTTDPYILKFLNIISKETAKIESTLKDLFSTVEEEKVTLQTYALFPLIRQSVLAFYTPMKEQGIEYILNLSGNGPNLLLDEKKIRRTFLHLIKNSIETMPDGGKLRIESSERPHTVIISFHSNGRSRSPDNSKTEKVFFSTTTSHTNAVELTLVDRTVRAHGGTFTLQGTERGETLALITLPLPGRDGH